MLRGGHSRLTSSLPSRTDRPPGSAHTTLTQKPSGRMRSPHTGRRRTVGFPPATASAIRRTVSRICAYCATGTLKVPLSARSPWRSTPAQREMLANGAGQPSQSGISSDALFVTDVARAFGGSRFPSPGTGGGVGGADPPGAATWSQSAMVCIRCFGMLRCATFVAWPASTAGTGVHDRGYAQTKTRGVAISAPCALAGAHSPEAHHLVKAAVARLNGSGVAASRPCSAANCHSPSLDPCRVHPGRLAARGSPQTTAPASEPRPTATRP